jgi:hypothetical protein
MVVSGDKGAYNTTDGHGYEKSAQVELKNAATVHERDYNFPP